MSKFLSYFATTAGVVGLILTGYGSMLMLLAESYVFITVGAASYIAGAYQVCLAEPEQESTF